MADVGAALSSARQAIGEYFSVVSVLPSVLLVGYLGVLWHTGAWSAGVSWARGFRWLADLGLGGWSLLVGISITFAVVLHPLQFTFVQILEGYWGVGRVAQRIRARLIRRHLRRHAAIWDMLNVTTDGMAISATQKTDRVEWVSLHQEASRLRRQYPRRPDDIMPTRLGNMLRRYEVDAGGPYGANLVAMAPLLAMVAPPHETAYVNDQRSSLDLAVRSCVVCVIATVSTILTLWDNGAWLLVALVPYGGVYLTYRGAVVNAEHYCIALVSLLALNRFALYERLRLPAPRSTAQEDRLNKVIEDQIFAFRKPHPPITLKQPAPPR
jgi:hypothetical protein